MDYASQIYIFIDVLIASTLTSLVGIEREKEDKPAGIRTNMIIGGASCLLISLIAPLVDFLASHASHQIVNADPIRVLNALIVGISFVGAGTILKQADKQRVSGLTTAATLLYSAGVGVSIALKQYLLGICITVLTILINHFLPKLFDKIYRESKDKKK